MQKNCVAIVLSLLLMPTVTLAGNPLVIHNNTDLPSTCIINGGVCSNVLPGVGVTWPHSTNTVPGVTVRSACWASREACSAVIYMSQDCTGASIGTVVLSTKTGVKSISPSGSYSISGSGFEVTIG